MREIALEQVGTTNRLAEAAIANRIAAVELARGLGLSWTAIGAAMGVSRQTAHKRFGQLVAEPDPADVDVPAMPAADPRERHVSYRATDDGLDCADLADRLRSIADAVAERCSQLPGFLASFTLAVDFDPPD